jgi:hypothetical protein
MFSVPHSVNLIRPSWLFYLIYTLLYHKIEVLSTPFYKSFIEIISPFLSRTSVIISI